MIEIDMNREVQAPIETVWRLISDLENEQKFWPILRNVKILNQENNTVEREATIRRGPMGDAKSIQTLVIDPKKRKTSLTLTKGPMLGTRRISLKEPNKERTQIEINWEFQMKGVPRFALDFVKDSISDVTEKALFQMAKEAEQISQVSPSVKKK